MMCQLENILSNFSFSSVFLVKHPISNLGSLSFIITPPLFLCFLAEVVWIYLISLKKDEVKKYLSISTQDSSIHHENVYGPITGSHRVSSFQGCTVNFVNFRKTAEALSPTPVLPQNTSLEASPPFLPIRVLPNTADILLGKAFKVRGWGTLALWSCAGRQFCNRVADLSKIGPSSTQLTAYHQQVPGRSSSSNLAEDGPGSDLPRACTAWRSGNAQGTQ